MLEDFVTIVKEVGFPIAVASFDLFRLNGKLDRLTEALHKLVALIERSQEED